MRTLWGRTSSSNVMKVLWLMEELGLPYQRIDAGGTFGGTHTPEYLAMNPNSLVPTLQEDGFTLWESNAILRYLGATQPAATTFWPENARQRALIDHWMDWQQTTIGPPMTVAFTGLVRTAPEQRDTGAIEAAVAAAGKKWSILDHHLAERDYIAGSVLTLADIPLGVHVHRWFSFVVHRPETPHLNAWYHRLLHRPAYRKHCAQPLV